MMLSFKDIYGLKIYSLEEGSQSCEVAALTFDPKEQKIKTFLVKGDGSMEDIRVVFFNGVVSFGLDAVIIESTRQLIRMEDIQDEIGEILKDSDACFNSKTGQIEDMRASQYFSEVKDK